MNIVSIRPVLEDVNISLFNVAAWVKKGGGGIILLGRELTKKGIRGEPDIGKLILYEFDEEDRVIDKRVIWEPNYESFYLEDPRAFVGKGGRIIVGLTAVLRVKKGIETFPAAVSVDEKWESFLPPVTLIQTFGPGKNTTPLLDNYFLFRPDRPDYSHGFLVFYYNGAVIREVGKIDLPQDIYWAEWKMGAGCPPIWVNDSQAIFVIHGITKHHGKYVYSIGVSLMEKKGRNFSIKVCRDPILTSEALRQKIKFKELRPHLRKVVYVCGGIIKPSEKDLLHLYVNVGDQATYDVAFKLKEIKRALNF